MKLMIKTSLFVIFFTAMDIKTSVENNTSSAKTTDQKSSNLAAAPSKVETKPKQDVKKKPENKNTKAKLIVIERTIFENCRVNDILLTITDHKNWSFSVPIKMGQKYEYYNRLLPQHLSKVVCYEKNSPKIVLPKQDLETYSVFVFNDEQNTNKYHFINPIHHALAKKRVRDAKNLELLEEINQQTIYHP